MSSNPVVSTGRGGMSFALHYSPDATLALEARFWAIFVALPRSKREGDGMMEIGPQNR